MNRSAWIYGISSSEAESEIKYIGVSVNPALRFKQHLAQINSPTAFKSNPKKVNWMKSTLRKGFTLELKILAEFHSEHEAYAAEESFIQAYRDRGIDLTNIAAGGIGGFSFSDVEKLEEFYRKRAETHRTPEFREKSSRWMKKSFEDPERYETHVEMVRRNGQSDEWKAAVREGLRRTAETNDFRAKANETRRLPENRERVRDRANKQFSSEESREKARQFARKRWDNTPPEQRVAWNKGLKTAPPKPPKLVVGSVEFTEHLRKTTSAHFEKLKADPTALSEYQESRRNAGLKSGITKRYNRAKKNGLSIDVTPISKCKACG